MLHKHCWPGLLWVPRLNTAVSNSYNNNFDKLLLFICSIWVLWCIIKCSRIANYCCAYLGITGIMEYGIAPLAFTIPRPIHSYFNKLRPRQNGCHFAEDIFKWIFLNESSSIAINISLKFVPKVPINNIPALVQIRAWCCPGDKPLSEPMMVNLPTHICVTRPQWVEWRWAHDICC